MAVSPPAELAALTDELGLVSPAQWRRVARQAQRVCRGLPLLDAAWIDALVELRRITPFQAAQLQAGQGRRLLVGDWLLQRPVSDQGYAQSFLARRRADRAIARLTWARCPAALQSQALTSLQTLIVRAANSALDMAPLEAGVDGDGVWAAWRYESGRTLAEILNQRGRLPGDAALEIARQMAAQLLALERAGVPVSDVRADQTLLTAAGHVVLLDVGMRAAVRPVESLVDAELDQLPPPLFDGLAPERAAGGASPSLPTDLFACGCLWWQLLCGRASLPAATARERIARMAMEEVPEVTELAPGAPPELVGVIRRCTARQPSARPASFADVAAALGSASDVGRRQVRACLTAAQWNWAHGPAPQPERVSRMARRGAMATVALLLAYLGWQGLDRDRTTVATKQSEQETLLAAAPASALPEPAAELPPERLAAALPLAAALQEGRIPSDPPGDDNESTTQTATSDSAVLPAAHLAPLPVEFADVVLPVGRPLRVRTMRLKPGQTVRGEDGGRPLVLVPADGLHVTADGATFEGIDFIAGLGRPVATPLIFVSSARATFRDCSFQGGPKGAGNVADDDGDHARRMGLPIALHWAPDDLTVSEPAAARLEFAGCQWRHVAAGVECVAGGEVVLDNCLHVGPGPWVAGPRSPVESSPLRLHVNRSTLRDAECLLRLSDAPDATLASLNVSLQNAVIAPSRGGCLVQCGGEMASAALPGVWAISKSVLDANCLSLVGQLVVDAWAGNWPEWILPPGLVAAELDFAGRADDAPAASLLLSAPVTGEAGAAAAPPTWPALP